jgi:hypothetical protein
MMTLATVGRWTMGSTGPTSSSVFALDALVCDPCGGMRIVAVLPEAKPAGAPCSVIQLTE